MRKSRATKRGGMNTTQTETATTKPENVFSPLSDEQLEYFRQKLLTFKTEQEEAALTACRVALMDADDVDHANIGVADIPALYNKYRRYFDRYEKTTVEYYINTFIPKIELAFERIKNKIYNKCTRTGGCISIDRLKSNLLTTESVVNGQKPTLESFSDEVPSIPKKEWYQPGIPKAQPVK